MFYESGKEHIRIIDDRFQTTDIPVGGGRVIGVSVNESKIAAIINWTNKGSGRVLLYDAVRSRNITEIKSEFYDLKWLSSDTLVLSDGNALYLCSGRDWAPIELCRYSRTPYGPLKIKASPDKKSLSFLKWRGDKRKIVLVDIDNGEKRELRSSCFSYSFFGNTKILIDHGGSISSIETATDKKTVFIKTTRNIISAGNSQDIGIKHIKRLLDDETCSIDQVGEPVAIEDRVYFSSLICAGDDKVVSLLSVDNERRDLKVHLQITEGLIENVYVSADQLLACVKISPNALKKEAIPRGWYQATESGARFIGDFLLMD